MINGEGGGGVEVAAYVSNWGEGAGGDSHCSREHKHTGNKIPGQKIHQNSRLQKLDLNLGSGPRFFLPFFLLVVYIKNMLALVTEKSS